MAGNAAVAISNEKRVQEPLKKLPFIKRDKEPELHAKILKGSAALAIFLESDGMHWVEQATATCVKVPVSMLSHFKSRDPTRNMLLTTAHSIKVPVHMWPQGFFGGGLKRFGSGSQFKSDPQQYFKVRAIVVFVENEQGNLDKAWAITTDLLTSPLDDHFLEEGVHYAVPSKYNYCKPYRKQYDFALIDLTRATCMVPKNDPNRNLNLQDALDFMDMYDVDSELRPWKWADFQNKQVYVSGYPRAFLDASIMKKAWTEHLVLLMLKEHMLFERKFRIVQTLEPRDKWQSEVNYYKYWRMPEYEREYEEVPKRTLASPLQNPKPVVSRTLVDVGEHLLLAQGEKYGEFLDESLCVELNEGAFCGGIWKVHTGGDKNSAEFSVLGMHIGGPDPNSVGDGEDEGGLYVARKFDETFPGETKTMAIALIKAQGRYQDQRKSATALLSKLGSLISYA